MKLKINPKGREINDFTLYGYLDADGEVHIGSDDISGFDQTVRVGCKTDTNLKDKLSAFPPGYRWYFPARIWGDNTRTNYFTVYSMEAFGDGGVKQSVRQDRPSNVAAVREAFDSLTALTTPTGVFVTTAVQESIKQRIATDFPRDFGISVDKAQWVGELIIHLMHEPAA